MPLFRFPVDLAHLRVVNENVLDARRFRIVAFTIGIIFLLVAVVLFKVDHPSAYILGAVSCLIAATALWVGFRAPSRARRVSDLYSAGALAPAIVAETSSRGAVLLALVNLAKAEGQHFTFVTRRVRSLPGHTLTVGERIPTVPDLTDRRPHDEPTWQVASTMPLVWGTKDPTVIAEAIAAIDEQEWAMLEEKLRTWNH